jgi:hypothetical protein
MQPDLSDMLQESLSERHRELFQSSPLINVSRSQGVALGWNWRMPSALTPGKSRMLMCQVCHCQKKALPFRLASCKLNLAEGILS